MLPDTEYLFTDYNKPNKEQEKQLRQKSAQLLFDLKLKSKSQLLLLLEESRNLFVFVDSEIVIHGRKRQALEHKYAVRLDPDGEKLMFSSENHNCEIQVCWWPMCEKDEFSTGKDSLCNEHALKCNVAVRNSVKELAKFSTFYPTLKDSKVKLFKESKWNLAPDLAPRERIAGAISALYFLIWPNHIMDPKAKLTSSKRQILEAKVKNCIFEYQDVAICYSDPLQAFMYMDLTDDEKQWKTICTHETCLVLAVEDHLKCQDHISQNELWKAKALSKILEIGGVHTLEEITEDGHKKILDIIRSRGRIPVAENVSIYCSKDVIKIRAGIHIYCFCIRKGCGRISKESLFCATCYFGRYLAVVLFKLTPLDGIPKFYVCKLDLSSEKDIDNGLNRHCFFDKEYIKAKREILFVKHLNSNDDDEAYSWKQALIMYLHLEANLFRVRPPLLNKQTRLGAKFWEAFTELCGEHGISFTVSDDFTSKHEISGFQVVKKKSPTFTNKDFTKTVYKVAVDELIYIGEQTIRAASGRNTNYAIRSALWKDKTLKYLVDRHNAKGLAFHDLPVDTVAYATSVTTSALYMETLIMIAFMIENQFFKNKERVMVNRDQSTCFMKLDWLQDLQLVLWKMFEKTFEMHGHENLLFENSFLCEFGLKMGSE